MRRPFAYPLLARMARMMGTQASEAPQSVGDYYKFAATLHAQLLASIDKNSNANSEANAAANKSNAEANKSLREAMEKVNDRSTEQSRTASFFSFFALKYGN